MNKHVATLSFGSVETKLSYEELTAIADTLLKTNDHKSAVSLYTQLEPIVTILKKMEQATAVGEGITYLTPMCTPSNAHDFFADEEFGWDVVASDGTVARTYPLILDRSLNLLSMITLPDMSDAVAGIQVTDIYVERENNIVDRHSVHHLPTSSFICSEDGMYLSIDTVFEGKFGFTAHCDVQTGKLDMSSLNHIVAVRLAVTTTNHNRRFDQTDVFNP